MATYKITVNGEQRVVDASPDLALLWVLRDTLGLTGTKCGCLIGSCGTCTVHVNGRAQRSCQLSLGDMESGDTVTTIEGLSDALGHRVQQAWIEEDVPQCGYCQSGQIMKAVDLLQGLLKKNANPTDADLDAEIDTKMGGKRGGVLCRCGTYQSIRKAIHRAAKGGVQ
jgi:isoquinoline 1-oxidoreductase alpha subunit